MSKFKRSPEAMGDMSEADKLVPEGGDVKKSNSMDEAQLSAIVEAQCRAASSFSNSDLSKDRTKALNYYLGKPFGNEVEGRSQVISTDVFDTIEGILPPLVEIFTSSNKIVECEPYGPEDEAPAKQQTEAANYVLFKQNNATLLFYTWFKDALLSKVGIVKYYYETEDEYRIETYAQLNEEELNTLASNEDVEIQEIIESVEDVGGIEMKLFTVRVKVWTNRGKICVQNIPPENFLITSRQSSLDIQKSEFTAHRERKTITDLKEMGFTEEELADVGPGDDSEEYSEEAIARDTYLKDFAREPAKADDSMREVWVTDAYIEIDYDGDGKGELRHVLKAGNTVLINEETDHVPFAVLCPIILPHEFYGLSIADITADIQLYKSTLHRQMMDNLYLTNNPRHAVIENAVNLEDVLTSRPGGIIRQKVAGAITPIVTPFVAKESFPMLEYWESVKENRTGVTRYNQGLDADSLNKTAHGITQIMSAAQKRQELVARLFAETGVKQLCQGILHCLAKSGMKQLVVKLTNGYASIDPREWKTLYNVTINVGLGTGTKERQIQTLMMLSAKQTELIQLGRGYMVSEANMYHMASKLAEAAGFKSAELFFTPPEAVPPEAKQPPPNPEMIKMQTDAQLKAADMQATTQATAAKIQNERQIAELQSRIKAEADIAVAKIQQEKDVLVAQIRAQVERELAAVDIQKQDKDLRSKAEVEVFRANNEQQAKLMDNEAAGTKQAADGMGQLLAGIVGELKSVSDSVVQAMTKNRVVGTKVRKDGGKVVATIKQYADGTEEEIPHTTVQ